MLASAEAGAGPTSSAPATTATGPTTSAPSDLEEEASVSVGGVAVDDAPVFPDEDTEMAMRSELRSRGEVAVAAPARNTEEAVDGAPLPPLDSLVSRLKPEVREVLDELFRARFTSVRRVSPQSLKEPVKK